MIAKTFSWILFKYSSIQTDFIETKPKTDLYTNVFFLIFSLQKTATAVAHCKRGHGLIRVNGRPLDNIEPKVMQYKLQEPLLLLGKVSIFTKCWSFANKYDDKLSYPEHE